MKKLILLILVTSIVINLFAQDIITYENDSLLEIITNPLPKKKTAVGIYHKGNLMINGLGLGMGRFSDKGLNENVITNGARFEFPGTSFFTLIIAPAFFAPPGNIRSMRHDNTACFILERKTKYEGIRIRYKDKLEYTNGMSLSLAGSVSGENHIINGLQISGVFYPYYQINGISITGFQTNLYRANGLSLTGLGGVNVFNNGVQLSGLYSFAYQSNGIQLAVGWNKAYEMKGVQIGGYNQSQQVYGLQIGIFNKTQIMKGLQIGVWNKNKKRNMPIINWGV